MDNFNCNNKSHNNQDYPSKGIYYNQKRDNKIIEKADSNKDIPMGTTNCYIKPPIIQIKKAQSERRNDSVDSDTKSNSIDSINNNKDPRCGTSRIMPPLSNNHQMNNINNNMKYEMELDNNKTKGYSPLGNQSEIVNGGGNSFGIELNQSGGPGQVGF